MLHYFPKYFTNRAIGLYFISLLFVSLYFINRMMSPLWMAIGAVSVIGFFYFSNTLSKKWVLFSEKRFVKNLIWTAFGIRVVWVVFSYLLYQSMTGAPFEFGVADAGFYNEIARYGSDLLKEGQFNLYEQMDRYSGGLGVSDSGYPTYLSLIYLLTGKSILIARLIKAAWGAWTVVLLYRLAQRNFGEETGRMTAIFAMLMPNLIYYCGLHLKEVEMVFLTVAFVERVDFLLRSRNYNFLNIFVPLLLAVLLFTFRTVLGAAALFSFFTAWLFSTSQMLGWGKRVVIGIWVVVAIGYFMGGKIATEVEEVWQARTENQEASLEFRANREGGNALARLASKSIFAPLIFNIPIPTMVNVDGQENQQLIHGGNYVKEIMVFFLFMGFIVLIRDKKWKEHVLSLSFLLGYLVILALSAFAQSERFHQPALPFILMFAAFGISETTNKQKKYFNWYMPILFLMFVAWQWFKLKGRGMA